MPKVKRQAQKHSNHHDSQRTVQTAVRRRQHSQFSHEDHNKKSKLKNQNQSQSRRPKIPFNRQDSVLLVGEGDFSFARSLFEHHKPASIVATCFDSKEALEEKYPHARSIIAGLQPRDSPSEKLSKEILATSEQSVGQEHEDWEGFSPSPPSSTSYESWTVDADDEEQTPSKCTVFYGIDATKLSTAHRKKVRTLAPFSKIVFNFPHIGGLSTDVNRQVRYNQEMLVGFLNAAKDLLSSSDRSVKPFNTVDHNTYGREYNETNSTSEKGQILVTLFEGEPYNLWNIRDLVRHCGLHVTESFKFPWAAYPGYKHARTIGEITHGKDRKVEGERKGAWRGEERDARCFVLETNEEGRGTDGNSAKKRKRISATGEDESD